MGSEKTKFKVTLKGGAPDWTNRSVLVGLSLYNSKLVGDLLLAYFKLLHRKYISHVDLVLTDTLERHNVMARDPALSEEQAKEICFKDALKWLIGNSPAFLHLMPKTTHSIWIEACPDIESVDAASVGRVIEKLNELTEIFNTHSYMIAGKHKYRLRCWGNLPEDLTKQAADIDESFFINGNTDYIKGMMDTVEQFVSRDTTKDLGSTNDLQINNHRPRSRSFAASLMHVREEYSVCAMLGLREKYDYVLFVGSEPPALRTVKLEIVKNADLLGLVNVVIEPVPQAKFRFKHAGNRQSFSFAVMGEVPQIPPETVAAVLDVQIRLRNGMSAVGNLTPQQAEAYKNQVEMLNTLLTYVKTDLDQMLVVLVAAGERRVITSPTRGVSPSVETPPQVKVTQPSSPSEVPPQIYVTEPSQANVTEPSSSSSTSSEEGCFSGGSGSSWPVYDGVDDVPAGTPTPG